MKHNKAILSQITAFIPIHDFEYHADIRHTMICSSISRGLGNGQHACAFNPYEVNRGSL